MKLLLRLELDGHLNHIFHELMIIIKIEYRPKIIIFDHFRV